MDHDAKRRRVEGGVAVKAEGAGAGAGAAAAGAAAGGKDFAEQFMAEQMKRMAEKMALMERELAAAKNKKSGGGGGGSGEAQPQNFELTSDGKRRVQVRTYRGQVQVDVREWYEKDGELRPGKRGLSLKVEQWKRLVAWIPKIEEAVESMS
jgi:hypothetical protein